MFTSSACIRDKPAVSNKRPQLQSHTNSLAQNTYRSLFVTAVGAGELTAEVVVGSLHPPNQPGVLHVLAVEPVLDAMVELGSELSTELDGALEASTDDPVEKVGAGEGEGLVMVVVLVVVTLSLHPNQPGVRQVVVVMVLVMVVVCTVVLSSRQPHPARSLALIDTYMDGWMITYSRELHTSRSWSRCVWRKLKWELPKYSSLYRLTQRTSS